MTNLEIRFNDMTIVAIVWIIGVLYVIYLMLFVLACIALSVALSVHVLLVKR